MLSVVCLSFACKHEQGPKSVSDQSKIPVPPPEPLPITIETCYAGVAHYGTSKGTSEADLAAAPNCPPEAEGCMDPQPIVLRRTATPEHSTIIEEWIEGPTETAFTLANGSIALLRRDTLREFPCADFAARREATLTAPPPI